MKPAFKQRKKGGARRKRKDDDDDDADDGGDAVAKAREQLANKKKEKKSKPKETKLLSFDDDDEDATEDFNVKKSNASRAMSKAVKRKRTGKEPDPYSSVPSSSTQPQTASRGGMYSAESLAELRKSQSCLSATQKQEFLEAGAEAQKVLKQEAEMVEAATRDDMQGAEPPPMDEDTPGLANDDQIALAKAMRERKRKIAAGEFVPSRGAGASEDFIPLSRPGKHSRGDRGDPAGATLRKVLGGKMTMPGQFDSAKQQEDELREWEDEQIRRGGRGTAAADPGAASALARKHGVSGPLWPAGAGGAGGAVGFKSVQVCELCAPCHATPYIDLPTFTTLCSSRSQSR
jgi:hypothetical protein